MADTYDAHETHRMREMAGARLATFPARAAALFIDVAVAGVLFFPLGLLVLKTVSLLWPTGSLRIELGFFTNWYSIAYLSGYFTLCWRLSGGRSPGKALLGIRVVSLEHTTISWWQAFERSLGYGASTLELGFGFLQYFTNRNHQTVHDRIAKTIVIAEPPRGQTAAT